MHRGARPSDSMRIVLLAEHARSRAQVGGGDFVEDDADVRALHERPALFDDVEARVLGGIRYAWWCFACPPRLRLNGFEVA